MAIDVEAEGNELIIRNDSGDLAIIPKNISNKVKDLLDLGNYEEVDKIVNNLPSSKNYAEDGSLYVGDPPDTRLSEDPPIIPNPYTDQGIDDATYSRYTKRRDTFARQYGNALSVSNKKYGKELNSGFYVDDKELSSIEDFGSISNNPMFQTRNLSKDTKDYNRDTYDATGEYWDKTLQESFGGTPVEMIQEYGKDGAWGTDNLNNEFALGGSINSPEDPPDGDPIEYDRYLGKSKFNTKEDLDTWNLQMQGKVAEGTWNLGQTPFHDLDKSRTFSDKYYGAGAKRFSDLIGEEAVTDLRDRRKGFSEEGLKSAEITDRLSAYAIETYGDQFIEKEDIYSDFGPRETSIIKEADTRLRGRRGLYGDATKANTAGTVDVNDTKFGFRNYINPQFIQDKQNYKDVWQPEETQQRTLQKRTNELADGGFVKSQNSFEDEKGGAALGYGGKIKAEDGLKIEDPPVKEETALESVGNFISEGISKVTNLFSDETKTAKSLSKNTAPNSPIRATVFGYPEQGLTNQKNINKFLSSKYNTRKGKLRGDELNELGCKGGSCNAVKFLHPNLKSVYKLEEDYGISQINTEHPETKHAISNNSVGIDSWETDVWVKEGMATELLNLERDYEKYGPDDDYTQEYDRKLKDFDINSLTIGTVLNSGDAVRSKYINKDAKTTYKVKGEVKSLPTNTSKSKHTRTIVGFDEKDGGIYIYDWNHVYKIPRQEMSEYLRGANVQRIIAPKNGDWTFKRLVDAKNQLSQ